MGYLRKKIQTKKQRKQKAGAYIGKGTYGCGFRPALLCTGETERRAGKFSKLMKVHDAEDEMRAYRILHTIDPSMNYFLYPEDLCVPAPPAVMNQVDSCPHNFHNLSKTRSVIQTDGGDNLHSIQIQAAEYPAFFRSLNNIIVGLERIHMNGIAHCDIKPENIVALRLDNGTFRTRLIDFGLMVDAETLDEEATEDGPFADYQVFGANYLFWPFEVRLVVPDILYDALERDSSIKRRIEKFYQTIPETNTSIPARALKSTPLSYANVGIMADQYSMLSPPERYASIFSGCDIHGLGMSLAQIYQRFVGHRDRGTYAPEIAIIHNEHAPVWSSVDGPLIDYSPDTLVWHREVARDISRPFYTLIRRMIDTNPQERATIVDVRVAYAAILPAMQRLFTVDAIRTHIKPFMTPFHKRDSPIENPPTPQPFPQSPLQEEPNRRPIPTPRPPVQSPLVAESTAPESNWRAVPKRGGSRRTRRHRR